MNKNFIFCILQLTFNILPSTPSSAQLHWQNVDSLYQPLPASVHVYFTNEQTDTGVFRAYYLIADLKDKRLDFTADTTRDRRITPQQFYQKDEKPLVVVNCTFFSFETNRSQNLVIKDGRLVAYNIHSVPGHGKDTFTFRHTFRSALGITKDREADIAWLYTDSSKKYPLAFQSPVSPIKDSTQKISFNRFTAAYSVHLPGKSKWKMQTAIGGGPVLLQEGNIRITNEEELMFAGKAINDKHPRTSMGYTKDGKLIILMVEGRSESAHGATLGREAQIFRDLGCWEALNLDGGGSSCLLINGKETIKPSDAGVERPVPAVFIIKISNKK